MDDQTDVLRTITPNRIEILTNVSGRRMWPAALKAKIVAESMQADAKISEVARRHGARASQVHEWRKQVREGQLALPADCGPLKFAPVVIAEPKVAASRRTPLRGARPMRRTDGCNNSWSGRSGPPPIGGRLPHGRR